MRAWHICGGQRTTSWNLFLPSILWGQPRAASAFYLDAAPQSLARIFTRSLHGLIRTWEQPNILRLELIVAQF